MASYLAETQITDHLHRWRDGDAGALEALLPAVYAELRRLAARSMRRERGPLTLQTTAVLHEAYLKLVDQRRVRWNDRAHFFAVASNLMRRVLLQHAERRRAAKRGSGQRPLSLELVGDLSAGRAAEVVALDAALARLETLDPRQAKIVELRFFGGLTVEEASAVLELSSATVKREWRAARAWLRRELAGEAA